MMKPSIVQNSVGLQRAAKQLREPDQRLASKADQRSTSKADQRLASKASTDWPPSFESAKPLKRIKETREVSRSIVDLPYEDIIVRRILPLLSIEDLLNLKLVSVLFNRLTVHYLRGLKRLDLSESNWLTSGKVKFMLAVSHKHLKQLDLSHNLSLNNRFLSRYLIVYRLYQIRQIKLNQCHWIDAQSFTVLLLLYGKQLDCLECAGCWSLNDELIGLLTLACPALTSLDLSAIYSLTDRSLLCIAHRCHNLRTLNLTGCWKLSLVGICWLIGRSVSHLIDLQVDQSHSNTLKCLNLQTLNLLK